MTNTDHPDNLTLQRILRELQALKAHSIAIEDGLVALRKDIHNLDKRLARGRATPKRRVRGDSKTAKIAELLLQKGGTTRQEILNLTNWPSVSVDQQAAAAGPGLRKEGTRGSMRYYGLEREVAP